MGDWLDAVGLGDQFDPRLCLWPPVPAGMAPNMAFLRESNGGWGMRDAETKFVVVIEVDPLIVWRQTSGALEAIAPLEARINALEAGFRDFALREVANIRRLHSLARWAKANFRVEEGDVMLLERLESGEFIRWLSNYLDCIEFGRSLDGKAGE